jgi:hypothetical protein
VLELFDLGFELSDRLFEIEEIHCHGGGRIKGSDPIS